MSLSTYYLEYRRNVAGLRRQRRVYAPTSNTASHDNHEKINSWVTFLPTMGRSGNKLASNGGYLKQ